MGAFVDVLKEANVLAALTASATEKAMGGGDVTGVADLSLTGDIGGTGNTTIATATGNLLLHPNKVSTETNVTVENIESGGSASLIVVKGDIAVQDGNITLAAGHTVDGLDCSGVEAAADVTDAGNVGPHIASLIGVKTPAAYLSDGIPSGNIATSAPAALSADTIVYVPVWIGDTMTVFGLYVSTLEAAKVFMLALYTMVNMRPATRLLVTGGLSLAAAGFLSEAIAPGALMGWYAAAVNSNSAGTARIHTTGRGSFRVGRSPTGAEVGIACWTEAYAYGTFPATATPVDGSSATPPRILLGA